MSSRRSPSLPMIVSFSDENICRQGPSDVSSILISAARPRWPSMASRIFSPSSAVFICPKSNEKPRPVNFAEFYVEATKLREIILAMSNLPWNKIFAFEAFDIFKVLLTALIILFVNKIQLFSDKLSALLIALPLTSLLAMIWMWHGGQSNNRIAGHAEGTFWFVLPTLPMFLILPWMLKNGWSFWAALGANCLLTAGFFWITVFTLRKFGINLM